MDTDPIKLVILGEYNVGKTSLLSRFLGIEIDGSKTFYRKTLSIDELGGRTITFDQWDTCRQEKRKPIPLIFYKEAGVIILVYDITSHKSFDEMKNYWYQYTKQYAPNDVVLGIAANKSDLIKEEQVSKEEAKQFADEIGASFEYTTKENNTGIERLIKRIAIKILDPNYAENNQLYKK